MDPQYTINACSDLPAHFKILLEYLCENDEKIETPNDVIPKMWLTSLIPSASMFKGDDDDVSGMSKGLSTLLFQTLPALFKTDESPSFTAEEFIHLLGEADALSIDITVTNYLIDQIKDQINEDSMDMVYHTLQAPRIRWARYPPTSKLISFLPRYKHLVEILNSKIVKFKWNTIPSYFLTDFNIDNTIKILDKILGDTEGGFFTEEEIFCHLIDIILEKGDVHPRNIVKLLKTIRWGCVPWETIEAQYDRLPSSIKIPKAAKAEHKTLVSWTEGRLFNRKRSGVSIRYRHIHHFCQDFRGKNPLRIGEWESMYDKHMYCYGIDPIPTLYDIYIRTGTHYTHFKRTILCFDLKNHLDKEVEMCISVETLGRGLSEYSRRYKKHFYWRYKAGEERKTLFFDYPPRISWKRENYGIRVIVHQIHTR